MKLLFIDTETGGIPVGVSVLTATFTFFSIETPNLEKLAELDVTCKPNDNLYTLDPEALMVNRIDLVEHRIKAKPYAQSTKEIVQFLAKLSSEEKKKLTLCGQNLTFDLDHLNGSGLLPSSTLFQYVDRRVIDIISLSKTAQLLGLLPEAQSLSLSKLAEFFNIPLEDSKTHSSSYDNFIAAQVYAYLIELIKGTI
jgi:DNA polymerase III epsilon subunit-like protein